jgi:YD repeat-containing protein
MPAFMPLFREDKSHIRDQLLDKKTYSFNNGTYTLVHEDVNTYTDFTGGNVWAAGTNSVKFYISHLLYTEDVTGIDSPFNGSATYGCLGCTFNASFRGKVQMLPLYYNSSKSVLTNTQTTIYDINGQNAVTSNVTYSYGNTDHLFPTQISTAASDGSVRNKQMVYPLDLDPTSCTNACDKALTQQISTQKQTLFSTQTSARNDYLYWITNLTPPPSLIFVNRDSVIAAFNKYLQLQQNFDDAVAGFVTSRNTCVSNYNSCVQSYYSGASDPNKAIIDMKQKNMIAPVLTDTEYKDSQLLSTTVKNYKTFTSSNTALSKIQFATGSNPLEDRIEILSYDANGNTSQQKKSNDAVYSYLWDYEGTLPIAEIANANISDIAYTSFEVDGNGNWNVGGTSRIPSSITGKLSYSLGSGSVVKSGLDPTKSYQVSFWSIPQYATVQAKINGATPSLLQSVNGGWGMYQITVSGVSNVTISGTDTIDELRLSPVGSQMTTFCYSPQVGMTSKADANQVTTYYHYDALGRLSTVVDRNGNILKRYTYQYQENLNSKN